MNDRWIVEEVFPGLRGGYFLEAGAGNGAEGSSCWVLEHELGWTGICVEPSPGFFPDLVRNRPGSICDSGCLAGRDGEEEFVLGAPGTASAYLSGMRRSVERKTGGAAILEEGQIRRLPAATLGTVLCRCRAPRTIDFFTLDIEGSELEVLASAPFEDYTFRAICLECDGSIWDGVTKLLRSHGYREVTNRFNTDQPWERYFLHAGVA